MFMKETRLSNSSSDLNWWREQRAGRKNEKPVSRMCISRFYKIPLCSVHQFDCYFAYRGCRTFVRVSPKSDGIHAHFTRQHAAPCIIQRIHEDASWSEYWQPWNISRDFLKRSHLACALSCEMYFAENIFKSWVRSAPRVIPRTILDCPLFLP